MFEFDNIRSLLLRTELEYRNPFRDTIGDQDESSDDNYESDGSESTFDYDSDHYLDNWSLSPSDQRIYVIALALPEPLWESGLYIIEDDVAMVIRDVGTKLYTQVLNTGDFATEIELNSELALIALIAAVRGHHHEIIGDLIQLTDVPHRAYSVALREQPCEQCCAPFVQHEVDLDTEFRYFNFFSEILTATARCDEIDSDKYEWNESEYDYESNESEYDYEPTGSAYDCGSEESEFDYEPNELDMGLLE